MQNRRTPPVALTPACICRVNCRQVGHRIGQNCCRPVMSHRRTLAGTFINSDRLISGRMDLIIVIPSPLSERGRQASGTLHRAGGNVNDHQHETRDGNNGEK
jgi:hypothetical protein